MAFTALAAGVSGLQAFTEGVGVIADNITNVNTIGYKETRSRFSTLVTETAALSSYSPGGVRAFSDTLVSKQGLLQPSGSATDLSIDGAGFFVVRQGTSAEDANGEFLFTRAGAFSQDDEGFYKNTAGLYLMGWPTDSTGAVSASNQSDLGELRPININNLNGFGSATSTVSLRVNLDTATAVTPTTTYDPSGGAYNASTNPTGLGAIAAGVVTADFETNITIYDSQGRSHLVNMSAIKTGTNSWSYEAYFDDPTVVDSSAHPNGLIASGELNFNTDGSIDLSGGSNTSTMLDSTSTAITFPGGSIPITFDSSGATAVEDGSITFDFGDDGLKNGFVQSSTESSRLSFSVDGAAFGNINGVSIGEDGIVTALFDNGLTLSVYKLPVAVFQNADGLSRRQGNAFGSSDLSGEVNLQHPGESGAGKVAPNSLEQSTVDLASEFAELIKVQRAFSASTRIITTSDQILEELTRL
ncbi:flagellar hook protein FlgE [Kordiimonas aestuarii]|uniref:flagellar hook protein FlgE n=1 Tax=Kordiimonas aestuarii TaxID=1005925 RepID=UPI0021D3A481|nr:flagellar hook-basal body complex protein [Kordiimonas aestuarii]